MSAWQGAHPHRPGSGVSDGVDRLARKLAEAEDRYQAAEHDLELLRRLVWQITDDVAAEVTGITKNVWYLQQGFGSDVVELGDDTWDALQRALDAQS